MDSKNIQHSLESSFRDPSGYLFYQEGVLYRQINSLYQIHYEKLKSSGLYNSLVSDNLLIPHREVPKWENLSDGSFKIIQPELVDFVSYPYE